MVRIWTPFKSISYLDEHIQFDTAWRKKVIPDPPDLRKLRGAPPNMSAFLLRQMAVLFQKRHRPNEYLDQRVPSLLLDGSFMEYAYMHL